MSQPKISKTPLGKIALSCSGGGYRAASFHLGTMSYLNRVQFKQIPLLERVSFLSTVSGGTITGVIYALKKQQNASFNDIYHFILRKLHTLDLVKEGIVKLNPGGKWNNEYKRKNLINAFAELYDKEFTGGAKFDVFDIMHSHLEAVVFNSTEFNNGINFRFRNKESGYFGNYIIRIPEETAAEVKLSDAIAASSCFTGGFEPMLWPHDFVHDGAPLLKDLYKNMQPIGIMDGGIYDNQGIESILLYKRNDVEPYFDLVIISDVASPYMKAYLPTADQPKEGFRSLTLKSVRNKASLYNRRVNTAIIALIAVCFLLPIVNNYSNSLFTGLCLGLAGGLLILLIIKIWLLKKINKIGSKLITSIAKLIPPFFLEKLSHLKIENLSVRRIEPLILDRLNSLITLLMDVFLKVVRRLNYDKLYDNESYKYRRASNLIRELTEADFNNKRLRNDGKITEVQKDLLSSILRGTYEDVVGLKIKKVAEEAASFGTTLWFTEEEQLDQMLNKLLASGQFTMCYNLLVYLESILFQKDNGFDELAQSDKDELFSLYEKCKNDWLLFREDPMFLCKELSQI